MVGVGAAALVMVTSARLLVMPPRTVPEVMEPGAGVDPAQVGGVPQVGMPPQVAISRPRRKA